MTITRRASASTSGPTVADLWAGAGPSTPVGFAHRGGARRAPENTREAFLLAADLGYPIELDVQVGRGGALIVMHDDTLTRTTSSTGNTADQHAASLRTLAVDPSTWWYGSSAFGTLRVPSLPEVLDEFGGKHILLVEAKNSGSGSPITTAVAQRSLERAVIVQSFALSELVAPAAAGIATMYLGVDKTAAELAAAGVTWLGADYTSGTVTEAWIAGMHAQGIKVVGWTPNRQSDVETLLGKGADGVISDDPPYALGAHNGYSYLTTSAPFDLGMPYAGALQVSSDYPGKFANGGWGYPTDGFVTAYKGKLVDGINPIGGDPETVSYTIQATVKVLARNAADRHIDITVGASTDAAYLDTSGSPASYNCLCRVNGLLQVYTAGGGASSVKVAEQSTTAIADNDTVYLTITVTPTTVAISRHSDAGRTSLMGTATATDNSRRGGYVHIGQNGVAYECTQFAVTG